LEEEIECILLCNKVESAFSRRIQNYERAYVPAETVDSHFVAEWSGSDVLFDEMGLDVVNTSLERWQKYLLDDPKMVINNKFVFLNK